METANQGILWSLGPQSLETKYRDIADGNLSKFLTALPMTHMLETKYRDIADGNNYRWARP